MLSPNTLLCVTDDATARPIVHLWGDTSLRLFYGDLSRAESVYGNDSAPVRAVLQRHLGAGVVAFWHLYSAQRALALGENVNLPDNVRAFALALAAGVPLPGSYGSDDSAPPSDGGSPDRVPPPRPRKPSPGNARNPLAGMLAAAGAA
jgi:hypothetical protein